MPLGFVRRNEQDRAVIDVLEANPRASRTVPFTSKATAVPLAKACARVMLGATIAELRAEGLLPKTGDGGHRPLDTPISVKEAGLPFGRFRGQDHDLGRGRRAPGGRGGFGIVGALQASSSRGLPT